MENDDAYVPRDQLNESFKAVHDRVDGLEQFAQSTQVRITHIETTLSAMAGQQNDNATRLTRMESHLDMVLRELGNVRTETARWAQEIGRAINLSTQRLDRLSIGQVALVAIIIIANFVLGTMLYRLL